MIVVVCKYCCGKVMVMVAVVLGMEAVVLRVYRYEST